MDQITATLKWARKPSGSGLSCDSHVQQDRWCHQPPVLPQGASRFHVQLSLRDRSCKILYLLRDTQRQSRWHTRSARGVKGKDPQDRHRSGFNGVHGSGQVQEGQASPVLHLHLVSRDRDVQHLSECLIVHDSTRVVSRVSCDLKLVSLRDNLGDHAASASQTHWESHQNHLRQSSSHGSSSHIRWRIPSITHRVGDRQKLHCHRYADKSVGTQGVIFIINGGRWLKLQAAWKEELRVNSWFSSPHHQCRQTHILVSSCQVSELGLVTVSTSSSKHHQVTSSSQSSSTEYGQLSISVFNSWGKKLWWDTTKGACQTLPAFFWKKNGVPQKKKVVYPHKNGPKRPKPPKKVQICLFPPIF